MGSYTWSCHVRGADLDIDVFRAIAEHYNPPGLIRATSQVCHPAEAAHLADQLGDAHSVWPHHRGDDETSRAEAEKIANGRASRILARLDPRAPGLTTQRVHMNRSAGVTNSQIGAWGGTVAQLPCPQKWGSAYAIPTADETDFELTERAVPVDVTRLGAPDASIHDPAVTAHVHDELTAQLGRNPRIATIEVLDDNPRFTTRVASTEGPVVTRYRIYTRTRHGALHPVPGEPEPTMAKARQKIKALLTEPVTRLASGDLEYVALGEKVRSDGSPLLTGRRDLVSRLVVYRVRLVTPKTPAPQVTGWQVYGVSSD